MTMYQLLGVKINRILISWIAIILKFIIFSIIAIGVLAFILPFIDNNLTHVISNEMYDYG